MTFMDTGRPDETEPDTRFRIVSAQCEAQPGNAFGEVTSGYLVIQAAALTPRYFEVSWEQEMPWLPSDDMKAGKLVKKDRLAGMAFRDMKNVGDKCFPMSWRWFRLDVTPDADANKDVPAEIEAVDVRCVVVSRAKDRKCAYCLVLGRHPTEAGAWERLGVVEFADTYKRRRGDEVVFADDDDSKFDFADESMFDTAVVDTFRIL